MAEFDVLSNKGGDPEQAPNPSNPPGSRFIKKNPFSAMGSTGDNQKFDSVIYLIQGRIYHGVFDLGYTETRNPIGTYIENPSERAKIATRTGFNREVIRSV